MVPGALSPQKFNMVELFFETGQSQTMAVNQYVIETIEDAFDMAFDTLQTTAQRDAKGVKMLNQMFDATGTFNFTVGVWCWFCNAKFRDFTAHKSQLRPNTR
jgi:hypothetical protein